jgi:hypothetical protein
VTRWNDAGSPIYGTLPAGIVHAECPPRFDPAHFADSRWSVFLHQHPKTGQLYGAFNDWTRDWCDYADGFMHQWSPKGQARWTAGRKPSTTQLQTVLPGEVYQNLRGIAGIAHDCVIAIDVNGGWYLKHPAITYVWDQDGLYVGGLLDNPELDGIEKHWYQCSGEFCHASVHTLPSGEVLFYANWENEVRIYRISGWDGWTRQSGKIRLDQARPARTGQGLAVAQYDDAAMTKLRSFDLDRQIDVKKPRAPALRWTGTLLPEYGPSYVGPWTKRGDKDNFEGGTHSSRDNDASVTFRFRGTSIDVVGFTGTNYGNADIFVDGKLEARKDCYSAKPERNVSLFAKSGLAPGDHEVTVKVLGWLARPRNKASSDAWVSVDKFVVDGKDFDDAGLPYTFTTSVDAKLWIDRAAVLGEPRATGTVKLQRRQTAIQLDYVRADKDAGVTLSWSSPFEPRQPIPTRCLYPVTPGGYTMETLRHTGTWPR